MWYTYPENFKSIQWKKKSKFEFFLHDISFPNFKDKHNNTNTNFKIIIIIIIII